MTNKMIYAKNNFVWLTRAKLTAFDDDLVIAAISKFKNKNISKVRFSLEEIKKLTNSDKNFTKKELIEYISEARDRIFNMCLIAGNELQGEVKHLFKGWKWDFVNDSGFLEVDIYEECIYLFNNFVGEYFWFTLADYTSLKSKYAKRLFTLLSSYRKTGEVYNIEISNFCEMMGYNVKQRYKIKEKVLVPAVKECSKHFMGLTYKINFEHTKGRPKMKSISFSFEGEIRKKELTDAFYKMIGDKVE